MAEDKGAFLDQVQTLRAIPDREGKQHAWDVLSQEPYKVLFMDDDVHPVVWDAAGVLRFQADPIIEALVDSGVIDLNRLRMEVQRGRVPAEMERKVAKASGYSLQGYFDLSYVQKWARQASGLDFSSDPEDDEHDEAQPKRSRTTTE